MRTVLVSSPVSIVKGEVHFDQIVRLPVENDMISSVPNRSSETSFCLLAGENWSLVGGTACPDRSRAGTKESDEFGINASLGWGVREILSMMWGPRRCGVARRGVVGQVDRRTRSTQTCSHKLERVTTE